MLIFGHVGITTEAMKIYENVAKRIKKENDIAPLDYRFVALGSVLPDIIDKPIGAFFLRGVFHNSRIFAHSLIFSILLLIFGIYYFFRKKNNNIILLAAGSFIHLILDSMWLYPTILYWPFSGLKFPQRPEGHWLLSDILRLISDPFVYGPELLGAAFIFYYTVKLIKNKKLRTFFKTGML